MADDDDMIRAPFTEGQVLLLNRWQTNGAVHPFTCGRCRDERGVFVVQDGCSYYAERALVATLAGWICPTCDYTQNWAHAFMAQDVPKPEWAI